MGYQLFSDMTADVSEALMRGMPEVAYVPMQVELGGEFREQIGRAHV